MNPLEATQARSRQLAPRRGLSRVRRLAPALLLALAPLLGAGQTAVVEAASGDCTTSGSQVSCTFSYTGAEQAWQVPVGVSSVQVTAVGGAGGSNVAADGTTTVAGGKGAKVTATVPLPAGTKTLYVEVGAGAPVVTSFPAFNGGGGTPSHAGGAASDVRTCSMANCPFFHAGLNACDVHFYECDSRLVVAGGGGGAGGCAAATGGPAGDSAVSGAGAGGTDCAPGSSGGFGAPPGAGGGVSPGGGGGGGPSIIGAGYDNVCVIPIISIVGTVVKIDVETWITNPIACVKTKAANPGFGGAGYEYGGDGGIPATGDLSTITAGGGGAGSSFWLSGATNTSMATDTTGTSLVTLTYTTPDTTPPSASPSLSPAATILGWNNTDVTVNWNWTDSGAGIDTANCTTSSASSGEGVQRLSATCKDLAGNQGSASWVVRVDKTPPTNTVSAVYAGSTTPYVAGTWTNQSVTVSFVCADSLSGCDGNGANYYETATLAPHTDSFTVSDKAGNTVAASFGPVQIDMSAPVAIPTQSPAANAAGWNTSDVTVNWNWLDLAVNIGGSSGLDTASCTPSSTSSGDGVFNLSAQCKDGAGNVGTGAATVKVDKTPPVVSCPSPAPSFVYGQSGATVAATVTDATSGAVQSLVSASVPTSSLGSNLSVSLTGLDIAGNTSTVACSYSVSRAATTTQLASSLNPAMLGQAVTFTATLGVQSPGAGSITGSVSFLDGTSTLGTGTVSTTGGVTTATLSTSSLGLGPHTISAAYGGSTNFSSSTSASLVQHVDTNLSSYPKLANGAYNLSNVNLAGGYFANLNLAGADVSNANVSGANFSGANLSGANLTNANFSNTNLSGATLNGANLTQTNLKGATGMSTATLSGVIWSKTTCPDNTNSSTDGGTCLGHL